MEKLANADGMLNDTAYPQMEKGNVGQKRHWQETMAELRQFDPRVAEVGSA